MNSNIKSYPNYSVDQSGNIFNLKSGRKLKLTKTKNGYLRVCLSKNNTSKILSVHRLVANAFIPNPLNLKEINHINGIKEDNNAKNLEWSTRSNNQKHAYKLGLQLPTSEEKNPGAKLTEEQVKEIIKLYSQGLKSKELENRYFVNQSTISRIINNKTWNYAR